MKSADEEERVARCMRSWADDLERRWPEGGMEVLALEMRNAAALLDKSSCSNQVAWYTKESDQAMLTSYQESHEGRDARALIHAMAAQRSATLAAAAATLEAARLTLDAQASNLLSALEEPEPPSVLSRIITVMEKHGFHDEEFCDGPDALVSEVEGICELATQRVNP